MTHSILLDMEDSSISCPCPESLENVIVWCRITGRIATVTFPDGSQTAGTFTYAKHATGGYKWACGDTTFKTEHITTLEIHDRGYERLEVKPGNIR